MKNTSNKGLPHIFKIVMGISLIITGVTSVSVDFYNFMPYMESMVTPNFLLDISSEVLLIAGGIILIVFRRWETGYVVGITGIVIAVSDFVSSVMTLYANINVTDMVMLVVLVFIAIIPMTDIFLVIFSIRYIQGHKRNALRMAITICVPLFIFLIDTTMALLMMRNDPESFWVIFLTYIPRIVNYCVLLWFLMLPGVKEDMSSSKVSKLSEHFYRSAITDPKASIYRGDLKELIKKLENVNDWGSSKTIPGAKEFEIMFGRDMYLKDMTFRVMDGSDKIRVSITRKDSKECIQAMRFDLREVAPIDGNFDDCKFVEFFGEDGFFIRIAVRDNMPIPMETYAIDRWIDRIKGMREKKDDSP